MSRGLPAAVIAALIATACFTNAWAADSSFEPMPDLSKLLDFRSAGRAVGERIEADLGQRCKKRENCLIELVPITKTAGLTENDIDLILLGVMDPALKNYRFWAEDEFRLRTMKRLEAMTIYDPGAEMKFRRSGKGERYQLRCSLTANERENKVNLACELARMAAIIFRTHEEFHHPAYIKAMHEKALRLEKNRREQEAASKRERQNKEAARKLRQEEQVRQTEFMWKITWVAAGVLFLVLFCCIVFALLKKKRKRRFLELMPQVKQQIQVHLEHGQFVAAEELTRRALLAVPEDTEILGAKSRLDIVTQGDTRKAEEAWVKARWAKEIRGLKRAHELLPALPEMRALAKYNPELADICTDTEKSRQDLEREQALAPRFDEIKLLSGRGEISEAMEKAGKILAEIPSSDKASTLVARLKLDREKAAKSLAEGKMNLLEGNLSGAASAFALAAEKDKSLSEAVILSENLSRSRIEKGLKLVPEGNSSPLSLCCNDSIDCGRELAVISIDDHRVSRNHCGVFLKNGRVLIEDKDSKNGTFLDGKRIQSQELQDGDLLSLAEAFEFKCRIHKAGGEVQAVVLEGKSGVFAILKKRLPLRLCGSDFSNANEEDELIHIAREGKRVVLQNGPGGLTVLAPGRKASLAGIKHYVEVLK